MGDEQLHESIIRYKYIMKKEQKKCEHFWLPAQIIVLDKYKQEHDSIGNSYRWRDVLRVERIYCAKCGKNCYADLSDLK